MIEEHMTEEGKKYVFDVKLANYLSHTEEAKCIVIISGFAITIMTPYETMKSKKMQI